MNKEEFGRYNIPAKIHATYSNNLSLRMWYAAYEIHAINPKGGESECQSKMEPMEIKEFGFRWRIEEA